MTGMLWSKSKPYRRQKPPVDLCSLMNFDFSSDFHVRFTKICILWTIWIYPLVLCLTNDISLLQLVIRKQFFNLYYEVMDVTSYDDFLRGALTCRQLATVTRRLTKRVAATTLEMMCCCFGDPMLSS